MNEERKLVMATVMLFIMCVTIVLSTIYNRYVDNQLKQKKNVIDQQTIVYNVDSIQKSNDELKQLLFKNVVVSFFEIVINIIGILFILDKISFLIDDKEMKYFIGFIILLVITWGMLFPIIEDFFQWKMAEQFIYGTLIQ